MEKQKTIGELMEEMRLKAGAKEYSFPKKNKFRKLMKQRAKKRSLLFLCRKTRLTMCFCLVVILTMPVKLLLWST